MQRCEKKKKKQQQQQQTNKQTKSKMLGMSLNAVHRHVRKG